MHPNPLLRNADRLFQPRFTGYAIMAYGVIYLFIRLFAYNTGNTFLFLFISVLCLLAISPYFKSMAVIDPGAEATDEDDDACCSEDRGTPTEDSDLPVAEGGVA